MSFTPAAPVQSQSRVASQRAARARVRPLRVAASALFVLLLSYVSVLAHSVGQVQTTKFMAPETVALLASRAAMGMPGLQNGDVLSYIIQFSPIANGADVGAGGYITDYLPPGVQVIGASIVKKDTMGNFYQVAPNLPGGIDLGWGNQGPNTWGAPFNVAAYDPTGRCAAAGKTNNCNGRMTEIYADTGIFFSTHPRTAAFPALPTRIQQGTNGYRINPTADGQLNPIIGQAVATTHNLWDADQTNAFGSTAGDVAALPASPKSSQASLSDGRGPTPYFVGSAVAGPQTGYQLDNTAAVGPWQRIKYIGSRIGDSSLGPALVADLTLTGLGGMPTSLGWDLSPSNPLPLGTNAVRWAVGKLTVGEIRYVKISLKLVAPPPLSGILNSSEVFGGDAGDADQGQDNAWRYHVPSVADNNSNLYIFKNVVCVYVAGVCQPSDGSFIAANSKVRYRITYANYGAVNQTNVMLTDLLPCQTGAAPVSYNGVANTVNIVSGPILAPSGASLAAIAAGNCAPTPPTRRTVTFPTLATLVPGGAGAIELDVQTNAPDGDTVTNTGKVVTTEVPGGATSNENSYVQSEPNLLISKTTSTPTVSPGGVATYTITVKNTGSANATGVTVYDLLPTMGGAANATTRFSYLATTSFTGPGLTSNAPAAVGPPPTLSPYDVASMASNQQQVTWTTTGTLAPGNTWTLVFTSTVGSNVASSSTPYTNTTAVTYTGGPGRSDAPDIAPVTVISPLTVTKSALCFFVSGTCTGVINGGQIPASAKVRYQIDYANTSGSPISNVVLSDTLPCQTAAAPVSYNGVGNTVNIVSGPVTAPSGATLGAILAGACPATRRTFSFPTLASLPAGATGEIQLDVQTNGVLSDVVANTATLSGTGVGTATSLNELNVGTAPSLVMSKVASTAVVNPGDTLSYTISVINAGTANATSIKVYDWLPTNTPANDVTTRFKFDVGTSVFEGITGVTPTVNRPPTQAPYNNVPTGSNPNLNNQEEVVWDFGVQTLAPGDAFTITFSSTVGVNMLNPANFPNYARVTYSGGAAESGAAVAFTRATVAGLVADRGTGRIEFATGMQYGTASFNIYAIPDRRNPGRRDLLNAAPILSPFPNSGAPMVYGVDTRPFDASHLLIEETEVSGRKREMGPFAIGDPRLEASLRRIQQRIERAGSTSLQLSGADVQFLPARQNSRLARNLQRGKAALKVQRSERRGRHGAAEGIKLMVRGRGPVSVRRADLEAQGLPVGVKSRSLRLFRYGEPVPLIVTGGLDEELHFEAVATDTTYTSETPYILVWSRTAAPRPEAQLSTESDPMRPGFERFERNYFYSAAALRGGDPWLWDVVVGDGSPWPTSDDPTAGDFDLPSVPATTGPLAIRVKLAAYSPLRHQVRAFVNNEEVGTLEFEGIGFARLDGVVPSGVLQPAGNRLSLRYSAVNGTAEDPGYIYLDYFEVEAPPPAGPRRSITSDQLANYNAALPRAAFSSAYVIITHPDFVTWATELAELKRMQGQTAVVVNVDRLYDRYSAGFVEAQAIRHFLVEAGKKGRIRDVVLFGDDTFDYRNFNELELFPVVPSLTGWDESGRVTSENAFADLDGDGAPDLSIGRLPAQTDADAAAILAKIRRQQSVLQAQQGRHLLVADNQGQGDAAFRRRAEQVASSYLGPAQPLWSEVGDDIDVARTALLTGLSAAPAVTHYFGHGGPEAWAEEQLLTVYDVPSLSDLPESVYFHWACYTQFFSYAFGRTLGETLLLSPKGGALASFGPAGITDPEMQAVFYRFLYAQLADPGITLGEAIRRAKGEAVRFVPRSRGVVEGFNLIGDPGLVIGGLSLRP